MVHLTGESSTPGRMGIILVCKLSSGREASDTVRSQEARQQARDASTIRAHGSRDRTASPRLLCSTPPFLQVYLLLSSFFYDTRDRGWVGKGGGACAVLLEQPGRGMYPGERHSIGLDSASAPTHLPNNPCPYRSTSAWGRCRCRSWATRSCCFRCSAIFCRTPSSIRQAAA